MRLLRVKYVIHLVCEIYHCSKLVCCIELACFRWLLRWKKTIIFKFSYLFFVICTSLLTKDLLFSLNCPFLLQIFFIYLAFLQCCSFLRFHFSFLQLASYRNRVRGKDTDMRRVLFSDKDTLFRRQGYSFQDYHLQYL